jgi:hypothetical protein
MVLVGACTGAEATLDPTDAPFTAEVVSDAQPSVAADTVDDDLLASYDVTADVAAGPDIEDAHEELDAKDVTGWSEELPSSSEDANLSDVVAVDDAVDAAVDDTVDDAVDAADASQTDVSEEGSGACVEAFGGCSPKHAALAESYCGAVEPDDPCAAVLIKSYESSGCASPCALALPGLEPICVLPECEAFRDFLRANGALGDECSTCACTPYCDGKACGSDGCSGSCGACADGSFCTGSYQCEPVAESCQGLTPEGCCSGAEAAVFCDQGQPTLETCGSPSSCGWSASLGRFSCVTTDAPVPPWLSSSCPAAACIPAKELCDGLPQQCNDAVDADDPDAMCAPLHASALGMPASGGWACSAPAEGIDGCVIASCAPEHFDVNGVVSDGCECKGTSRSESSASCGYAELGSFIDVAPGDDRLGPKGVIPLPDDGVGGAHEDWYYLTLEDDGQPLGTLTVSFAINSGTDYRFEVRRLCQDAAFDGLASVFGLGAPPVTNWRYSSDGLPSVDIGDAAGTGPWVPYVVIRVFRVEAKATCNEYQLRVRRQ